MITIIIMETPNNISTDELRFNFKKVIAAMKRGQRLLLTYRNTPLAMIEPISPKTSDIADDDPFYTMSSMAEALGSITSDEIDQDLYGCASIC